MLKLIIPAKKVLIWLLIILGLLLILHILGQYLWHISGWTYSSFYIDRFNMNEEISIPTWFATILLLASSGFLWIIGIIKTQSKDIFAKYWKILAGIFLFLSIDEGSSIHEILSVLVGTPLKIYEGMFYYAWVIPIFFLLIILAFLFFKFWQNLYASTRWLFFWAGLLYIGGALGVEMLGSYYVTKLGGHDFNYFLLVSVEEGLEKLGIIIFVYALIKYLARLKNEFGINFKN